MKKIIGHFIIFFFIFNYSAYAASEKDKALAAIAIISDTTQKTLTKLSKVVEKYNKKATDLSAMTEKELQEYAQQFYDALASALFSPTSVSMVPLDYDTFISNEKNIQRGLRLVKK